MDELKDLFGDESLDYAMFEQKLTDSGMKLVNLKSGGYVDKAKYDKLAGDFTKYKADNDVSKYADYDSLKAEVEQLRAEKLEAGYMSEAAAAGVDEKFREFVVSKAQASVTKDKDFKSCLTDYLKDNQQFITQQTPPKYFSGTTSLDMSGKNNAEQTTSQKMNNFLRGVVH